MPTKTKRLQKLFLKEQKEHPKLSKKAVWAIVYDHEKAKKKKK